MARPNPNHRVFDINLIGLIIHLDDQVSVRIKFDDVSGDDEFEERDPVINF